MYYTGIKHSSHLRTLEKCRKHSPAARAFHISLVFSNACRVLSQCNTRLRLLYLLNIQVFFLLSTLADFVKTIDCCFGTLVVTVKFVFEHTSSIKKGLVRPLIEFITEPSKCHGFPYFFLPSCRLFLSTFCRLLWRLFCRLFLAPFGRLFGRFFWRLLWRLFWRLLWRLLWRLFCRLFCRHFGDFFPAFFLPSFYQLFCPLFWTF